MDPIVPHIFLLCVLMVFFFGRECVEGLFALVSHDTQLEFSVELLFAHKRLMFIIYSLLIIVFFLLLMIAKTVEI